MSRLDGDGTLGITKGTALYVSAIIGPGILTLPGLAIADAGPSALAVLAAVLLLSVPVATTLAAIGRKVPIGGIPAAVTSAFGPTAGALAAAWFRYGVPIGVPALALIGGGYVAEATGGGRGVQTIVGLGVSALAMCLSVARTTGSSILTPVLTGLLIVMILGTALLALPHVDARNLQTVEVPDLGQLAAAALVLTWVLTGWEAVTNFTGLLRNGRRNLPIVTALALVIVIVLYLAVGATVLLVLGPNGAATEAPLGVVLDRILGPTAALAAAALALIVATNNAIAYVGSLAELGTARLHRAGDASDERSAARPVDRARVLAWPTAIILGGHALALITPIGVDELVSICAASQIPVYLLGLAAGIRLLRTRSAAWWCAAVATAGIASLLFAAGPYLIVPATIAVGTLVHSSVRERSGGRGVDRTTRFDAGPRIPSRKERDHE